MTVKISFGSMGLRCERQGDDPSVQMTERFPIRQEGLSLLGEVNWHETPVYANDECLSFHRRETPAWGRSRRTLRAWAETWG